LENTNFGNPLNINQFFIRQKPEVFILDVDGVFTDGKFYYSLEGKVYKVFGADDHDAIKMINKFVCVKVLTADEKGLEITRKRIEVDMGLPLELVPSDKRVEWIRSRFEPEKTIYMGDGIFDAEVFRNVGYSICPANALAHTKRQANFVTKSSGGDRAVAEACIHLLNKFFGEKISKIIQAL
jgi:3-deoxy-D-manno-octulosonate 8-phosphate phosphatase (KDO 8-P phosphatase)